MDSECSYVLFVIIMRVRCVWVCVCRMYDECRHVDMYCILHISPCCERSLHAHFTVESLLDETVASYTTDSATSTVNNEIIQIIQTHPAYCNNNTHITSLL